MSDKNFPISSPDSSKPILALNQTVGETGPPALYAYPGAPVVPIPCDNDGGNPVYTTNRSNVYIYQGGDLQSGWTIYLYYGHNCSALVDSTPGDEHINIVNVTADSGYCDFTAIKSGTTLRFSVYFTKVKEGEQGATGSTGSQGATGAQGPAGNDGVASSGLLIQKFTANVREPYTTCTAADNGSGFTRLTFGSDPDIEVGEYMAWSESAQMRYGNVTAEISPTVYDTDNAWLFGGSVRCWSMRYFRKNTGSGSMWWNARPQSICIPNIIPVGGKLDEVAVLKTDSNVEPLFTSGGYAEYPDSGYDRYWGSTIIGSRGDIRQVNLWDTTRFGYDINMVVDDAQASRNVYFYVSAFDEYQTWITLLENIVFDFFISYKFFPTTFTG